MARDYFTRAEFRTFAGDPGGASPTYSDADIDAKQAEVIDHLERWAGSAWPNVTGVTGDGTAAAPRSATEVVDGPTSRILLEHIPVIAVTQLENDGIVVASDTYWRDLDAGILTFGNPIGLEPQVLEVQYTYGYTSTPWAIKAPAMQATKSLLDAKKGTGSKVPANVSRYTTQTTTFEMPRRDKDEDLGPWAWDEDASEKVRSYWGPDRPRISVGAV